VRIVARCGERLMSGGKTIQLQLNVTMWVVNSRLLGVLMFKEKLKTLNIMRISYF
jgi:hypothetical protein